jgi:cell division protein FtsB
MKKNTKCQPHEAGKKTGKAHQAGLNEAGQITTGKVQELQQDVANLKAHLEVMRKEIDALNALIRHLEPDRAAGKT